MQFSFDADLKDVSLLAEQIFAAKAEVSLVAEAERQGGFDAELWRTLAGADLLGVALPEEFGGAGLGLLGLVAVLEQQGRRAAPVPLWAVVAAAAMPIARFGSVAHRQAWLPRLLSGNCIVTGNFETDHAGRPPLSATPTNGEWLLSGAINAVAAGPVAEAFVVPFDAPDGVKVAIIPADRSGVAVTPLSVTNRESTARVDFDRTVVAADDLLLGDGAEIFRVVRTQARVALAALCAGVCGEAVAITAAYCSQRIQFDRPLSTNQAVTQRAADAYLDSERIRLTTYKAAWHVDRNEDDEAYVASLVAKWWAGSGGLRVVSATQHLHGGMGADIDYPIHRYYLWGRQIFYTLGSAAAIEAELGDALAHAAAIGALPPPS